MELLTCGQKVKIQRTDGRIHSVVIRRLNHAIQALTVEWSESANIKGKDVSLDSIVALNPEIFKPQLVGNVSQPKASESSTKLIDPALRQLDTSLRCKVTAETVTVNGTTRIKGRTIGRILKAPTTEGQSTKGAGVNSSGIENAYRLSAGLATSRTKIPSPRTTRGQIPVPVVDAGRFFAGNITNRNMPPSTPNDRRMSTPTPQSSSYRKPNTANGKTTPFSKRSSYVVKTVENMKDNREKRRARHAELRQQKEDLKNQDPDNPHWEVAHMVREYQKTIEFNPLHSIGQLDMENQQITVCVRKRPLSRKERTRKEIDVISVPRKDGLIVHEPRNKVDLTKFLENHNFRFDYAFDELCSNELIYDYTAKPLVKTIFEGGRATCFAYGQTGSGKTHTMGGEFNGKLQNCENGIYAMAARDVFRLLQTPPYCRLKMQVSCSFFEIYGTKVFDLLTEQKRLLRVLEDGRQQVQVVGLTEKHVQSVPEVLKLIEQGNNERTSGQTSANSKSSRSHAVFQILIRKGESSQIHGKFSFIDLAGNERGADTSSATRQTRMEGADINKSLLALKECIRALGRQKAHLPFRVSKLTQVLRDSFIGGEKSRTCMIAMISPGLNSCEHTLNTLRYADRVKELVAKDIDAPDTPDNLSSSDSFHFYESRERKSDINRDSSLERKTNQIFREPQEQERDRQRKQHVVQPEEKESRKDIDEEQYKIKHAQAKTSIHKVVMEENSISSTSTLTCVANKDFCNVDRNSTMSSSDNEMSEEAIAKHVNAITEVQETEERVIEQHKTTNEFLTDFIEKFKALRNKELAANFDFSRAHELFSELADVAVQSQQLMLEFREKLENEELLSGATGKAHKEQ